MRCDCSLAPWCFQSFGQAMRSWQMGEQAQRRAVLGGSIVQLVKSTPIPTSELRPVLARRISVRLAAAASWIQSRGCW